MRATPPIRCAAEGEFGHGIRALSVVKQYGWGAILHPIILQVDSTLS